MSSEATGELADASSDDNHEEDQLQNEESLDDSPTVDNVDQVVSSSETAILSKPAPPTYIGLLLAALFTLGIYNVVITSTSSANPCQMTYMYEYPLYINLNLTGTKSTYELFAYAEGEKMSGMFQKKTLPKGGIPVLFIPGNSGSAKQVRSLASVALRKALEMDKKYRTRFDFFAVDFDEELSALSGSVLKDQHEFVIKSIGHILGMYKKGAAGSPRSVVLIGHSIGGVVAKSIFLSPDLKPGSVNTVITMATPHSPVLVVDWEMSEFYRRVDDIWSNQRPAGVSLFSIGGGERDIQVRSDLTRTPHADLHVVSTSVPGAWVSADHRCIVWCKQVVLSVVRALFDSLEGGQVSIDAEHRNRVFNYHLVQRWAGKKYKTPPTDVWNFDKDGYWSDIIQRQYVFQRGNVTCNTYLMIRALDDTKHRQVTLDAVNMDTDNWVFGCKASSVHNGQRVCDTGENLSDKSYILPSNGKRKTITVDMQKLRTESGYSHVVVFIPKHSDKVRVSVDVYNPSDRVIKVDLPKWMTFFKRALVTGSTAMGAVYYEMPVKELEQPWQAYTLSVEQVCKEERKMEHFGLMRLKSSLAEDTTQALIGHNLSNSLDIKVHSPKMPTDAALETPDTKKMPTVEFFLNPACNHKIYIQPSLPSLWGQMVRFYSPMLVPLMVADIIGTMAYQTLFLHQSDKVAYNFIRVLVGHMSPIAVVLPSKIFNMVFTSVGGAVAGLPLPTTDYQLLTQQGIDFGILPMAMFFAAHGFLVIISIAAWICVLAFGGLAHKTLIRIMTTGFSPGGATEMLADLAIVGASKFPSALSVLLVSLALGSCGSLSLCLGTFLNFVHLFGMYKDHLEKLVKNALDLTERKERDFDLSPVNMQFTNALLWVALTALNAPTLVTWTKGSMTMVDDPSLLPAIVASLCLPFTWSSTYPNPKLMYYKHLHVTLRCIAILLAAFATVSIYRVSYFIIAAMAANVIHQALAPVALDQVEKPLESDTEEVEETSTKSSTGNNPNLRVEDS